MPIHLEPNARNLWRLKVGCTSPVNTILPVISGTAQNGSTLSVTDGTWTGSTPVFTYQWKRDTVAIGSATNNTYLLVTADINHTITCTVTATNSCGVVGATSLGVSVTNTLLNNLISYWKMDEVSAGSSPVTRVDSVVASGNDLTDTNNTPSGTGIINNGVNLFAISLEKLTHISNASLQTGDIDFTVSVWIKPTLVNITLQIIVGKGFDTNTTSSEWFLYLNNDTLVFKVSDGSTTAAFALASFISAGVFTHLIISHDSINNKLNITKNAGTINQQSYSLGIAINTQLFTIGTDGTGIRYFTGIIDEIGFWKRVLTTPEISMLYNSGLGLSYPF